MLEIKKLRFSFGKHLVFEDVSLTLHPGEIRGIIGPNGAGKTTLFNVISGFLKPDQGEIYYNSRNITGIAPHRLRHLGIIRTFQQVRLFEDFTVYDNIEAALHPKNMLNYFVVNDKDRESIQEVLLFCNLFDIRDRKLKELSFGQKRMVQVAVSIACRAKCFLLDEPAAGLNSGEIQAFQRLIRKTHQRYSPMILLIDHNMDLIMNLVETIDVLADKHMLARGTPDQIQKHPEVLKVYLGEEYA